MWGWGLQAEDNPRIVSVGDPVRGVLALRKGRPDGPPHFAALHALDPSSAGTLIEHLPSGSTLFHLTEEWMLPILAARAEEHDPWPAWLLSLSVPDFKDRPDPRVRPVDPAWAGMIGRLWEPDWPSEPYVRSRIKAGPTAAIAADDEPVAWALTHIVTPRAALIGMVHVMEDHRRRGLARAVVSAVVREVLRTGRVPACHIYQDNAPSMALFESLGFRRVKRQMWGSAVLP